MEMTDKKTKAKTNKDTNTNTNTKTSTHTKTDKRTKMFAQEKRNICQNGICCWPSSRVCKLPLGQEEEVVSFTSSFITLHNLIYISQEERHTLSDVGTLSN